MSLVCSFSYDWTISPYSLSIEENNKYLDLPSSTQSPLALAKQMLKQNASLSEVALLLEAAIQKGKLGEGGYEAWILLGETCNMDKCKEAGMKALTERVHLAEAAGAGSVGMLVHETTLLPMPPLMGLCDNSFWRYPTRMNLSIALPM